MDHKQYIMSPQQVCSTCKKTTKKQDHSLDDYQTSENCVFFKVINNTQHG